MRNLRRFAKGAKLIVATPGRLEDYLDRKLFHFNNLRMLVLDEADRMLDMGFLPAIRRIVSILPEDAPDGLLFRRRWKLPWRIW